MTYPAVPPELAFLFPDGLPMDTGHQNFMKARTEEDQETITQSAQKIQNLWDEMRSELIAEIMVPVGDPEPLAEILDRLSAAAVEMASILRKDTP